MPRLIAIAPPVLVALPLMSVATRLSAQQSDTSGALPFRRGQ